jgi:hypothetical protein
MLAHVMHAHLLQGFFIHLGGFFLNCETRRPERPLAGLAVALLTRHSSANILALLSSTL